MSNSRGGALKHGLSKTREYWVWTDMKKRCYNENHHNFKYYGGKGIAVCDAWKADFMRFKSDMGVKPAPNFSLDRINPAKGYSKENCRWATKKQQVENRGIQINNKSTAKGVHYVSSQGSWRAVWRGVDGKVTSRTFSIRKHGKRGSFNKACDARVKAIEGLIFHGAAYPAEGVSSENS